jgi:hypothetical protein
MKLALEELQNARDHIYLLPENEQPLTEEQILNRINAAITVLHQEVYGDANRTSQKRAGQQEPVAWISDSPTKGNGKQLHWTKAEAWRWSSNITPLYTAPPQREWVGLTLNEAEDFYDKYPDRAELINAVDRFLEEKNHG